VRKLTFDPLKMAKFFDRANGGSKDVKVEVAQIPNSPNIQLNIVPKPAGGETAEQARKVSSVFRSQLNALKTNPKAVVWFHVCKDSIATYLMARDVVDQDGIPVGWEMWDKPTFSHRISPEYLVEYTAPPPPAPSATPVAAKPTGPPPVVIAAPKATVD
jgi:hypothetical protein